ncbi:MAG: hybrid sensor histidine kinase/response regulator [Thiotrichaceae bacterium]
MAKQIILCVDDEHTILDSLKLELTKLLGDSYIIETAEDALEALEVIENLLSRGYEIPLIISDHIMPEMKGDEFLKQVHQISPKTLKIMLTGQASIDAVSNAIKHAQLYRYIAKPWDITDFDLTVKEALHSYDQERQIERFYADLEQKIVERTQELHEKNAILRRLDQEKNEFLGIVAHDLKNPLSAIKSLSEEIERSINKMPQPQLLKFISIIQIASRQMFNLINNLLDVNAIESGKIHVDRQQLDILPIIQALLDIYQDRANEKQIQIHFCNELTENNVENNILGDENIVRQVLDNLISNALKYSPHNTNVYVRTYRHQNCIRCEIRDEGPGLSAEDQQKLFGKFARLTPRPTGQEHSTGLGLFIVKKLVERLKAEIWCESQLNQGTAFTVEFTIIAVNLV